MFSWLYNKFGLSKKQSPPKTPPKLVTIFNTVSRLSPDGEKKFSYKFGTETKKTKTKSKVLEERGKAG